MDGRQSCSQTCPFASKAVGMGLALGPASGCTGFSLSDINQLDSVWYRRGFHWSCDEASHFDPRLWVVTFSLAGFFHLPLREAVWLWSRSLGDCLSWLCGRWSGNEVTSLDGSVSQNAQRPQ